MLDDIVVYSQSLKVQVMHLRKNLAVPILVKLLCLSSLVREFDKVIPSWCLGLSFDICHHYLQPRQSSFSFDWYDSVDIKGCTLPSLIGFKDCFDVRGKHLSNWIMMMSPNDDSFGRLDEVSLLVWHQMLDVFDKLASLTITQLPSGIGAGTWYNLYVGFFFNSSSISYTEVFA